MMKRLSALTGLLVLAALVIVAVPALASGHVVVVKAFDESPQHLPEGITIDKTGSMYVGLGPPFFVGGGYGAVVQISPDGSEQVLVEYPSGPAVAGLAVDAPGNVYYALPNPGFPNSGVYRIGDAGPEQLPGTGGMLVPNGLAFDKHGNLYATDSALGSIWRMPGAGAADAESWLADELLTGCADVPGANGIAYWKGGFYVANTARGILVYVPIHEDGSPGELELIAGDPSCAVPGDLFGLDGIALDVHGNIYALLVIQNKLVHVDPADGAVTVLLTEEDGLWNPASLAFGTGMGDRQSLFMTNYAVLPPIPPNHLGPAVLKYDAGVPGRPLP